MNKIYIPALLLVILLAVAHFIASKYSLYVRYPGYDIGMHILGGIGIALSVYATLFTFSKIQRPSFWTVIILVFIAGFFWEAFEAYYDIAGAPVGTRAYYFDAVKDLFNDTLGAVIACFFLRKNNSK
ncbi:MAG: hypothetical protein Q8Q03_02575 [bacterium]|nr:hypothetical protein [bacterium]